MITSVRRGVRGWWLVCSAVFLLPVCAAVVLRAALPPQSSNSTAAKKDYALIYGTVWGPNNHTVAGVPITIRRTSDKKPRWELVSDARGEFAQRVPPGGQDYIVQANIKMPKGEPKPEVTVHIDDDERKDIGIHLSR